MDVKKTTSNLPVTMKHVVRVVRQELDMLDTKKLMTSIAGSQYKHLNKKTSRVTGLGSGDTKVGR